MATEAKRRCSYRCVGGMYLCGNYIAIPCDRLPYPLETFPTCDAGIKVTRRFTKINPRRLFDIHEYCWMCDPKDGTAFIMGVGKNSIAKQDINLRPKLKQLQGESE